MKHYTIKGYVVDCKVEGIYYKVAEKFIHDNDNFYVPRMIKYMIDEEVAKVCYEMPGTAKEIAEKLNMDEETVAKHIRTAIRSGVSHMNHKNNKAGFANGIVNLADFGITDKKRIDERGSGFIELVKGIRTSVEYLEGFGAETADENIEAPGEPLFRILPRYKAIKDIPGVMPCENMYMILKEHEGKLSTVRCMCRSVVQGCDIDEGDTPEVGHCVKLGAIAEHYVEDMELGRYMTADEVMKGLENTENKKLYHMIGNSRETVGGFCNCCPCCCDVKTGADHTPDVKLVIKPSRFLVEQKEEACNGCGECIKVCAFDAIIIDEKTGKSKVDLDKCMGCGTCVLNCPEKARWMRIDKPVDFIPEKGTQHILDSLNLPE